MSTDTMKSGNECENYSHVSTKIQYNVMEHKFIQAVIDGNEKYVKEYLDNEGNPNQMSNKGQPALIIAATHGYLNIMKLLIARGADIKKVDIKGKTVLMVSLENNHVAAVNFLLEKGADPNEEDFEGNKPINRAMKLHFYKIVESLLNAGATFDVDYYDAHGWTLLLRAVSKNHLKEVEFLLSIGADVNRTTKSGFSPLMCAANDDLRIQITELLLARGANTDAFDPATGTALMIAVSQNCPKTVELLINKGVDLDFAEGESGHTALTIASFHGMTEIAQMLINGGANINKPDYRGKTPIMNAIETHKIETVMALLANGADTEITYKKGMNALMLSILGVRPCFPYYMQRDRAEKENIEHKAAKHVFRILVKHTDDVNQCDNEGTSPLILALGQRSPEMVEVLLRNQADRNKKDKNGLTALDVAKRHLHKSEEYSRKSKQKYGEECPFDSNDVDLLNKIIKLLENSSNGEECLEEQQDKVINKEETESVQNNTKEEIEVPKKEPIEVSKKEPIEELPEKESISMFQWAIRQILRKYNDN